VPRVSRAGNWTLTAAAVAIAATAATAAPAGAAVDARVIGRFAMRGKVTRADHVRGEHKGERVKRTWRISPRCEPGVCAQLTLRRERSAHRTEKLTLTKTGTGTYSGRGHFYFALRCAGKVYRRGGRASTKVTLTVTRRGTVQGRRFATALKATYSNPKRTNRTPCKGRSLGRDAARYSGKVTTVPGPPTADFASTKPDPVGTTADFQDESARGPGGARISSYSWDFGDPASGDANTGAGPAPSHDFSAHGTYDVSLTVTDRNGLRSTRSKQVVV
jgi:hypothetical protein